MLRTDRCTDGRTDNVKTVYPLQTKFAGGIIKHSSARESNLLMILTWFEILLIKERSMKHSSANESILLIILTWFRTH